MMDYSAMGERLSGEYKEIFERAELYGTVKNVPEDVKDDLMMNLFDLLLTSQAEGRKASSVVGEDIGQFCKDYYADYNIGERAKRIPEALYTLAKFIFIFELIDCFLLQPDNVTIFEAKSNILPYFAGLIIGGLVLLFSNTTIKPLMFRKNSVKSNKFYHIIVLAYILLFVLWLIFLSNNEVLIPIFLTLLITGIYMAIYLLLRAIWRYRTYGTVRKYREEKSGFDFNFKESFHISNQEFAEALLKRYNRKNKRMKRHGRTLVTPEEFTKRVKKEIETEKKMRKWMAVFYAVVVFVVLLFNYSSNGLMDTVFFAPVLMVCETIIYLLWLKLINSSIASREKMFEEIDSMGLNIVEYAEMTGENTGNGKTISMIHASQINDTK